MEKNNRKMDTNNMITLCHIVDEFDEFEKRLMLAISPKYNRDFVYQLWDVSQGKFKIGARKAKRFYSENKSVIDIINKYSNVLMFINQNYAWTGKSTGNLRFFYEYLLSHKEEIPKILELLEKLRKLGFDRFEFNENLDFTTESYDVYPTFRSNFRIIYVDNIVVPPSYVSHINYGTTSSNYKIELSVIGDKISEYGKSITLNSLLFDSKRLPESIDRENIYDSIIVLKNLQEERSAIIRNSVDLSISVSDLEYQLNSTNSIISRLNGVENKEQLLQVLLIIKSEVEKLKTLSKEYDSSVSEKEPSLTSETLEIEKLKYLKRRDWARMDIH